MDAICFGERAELYPVCSSPPSVIGCAPAGLDG